MVRITESRSNCVRGGQGVNIMELKNSSSYECKRNCLSRLFLIGLEIWLEYMSPHQAGNSGNFMGATDTKPDLCFQCFTGSCVSWAVPESPRKVILMNVKRLLSIRTRKIVKIKSFGELKTSRQEEKDCNEPEPGIWANGEELRPEGTIVL